MFVFVFNIVVMMLNKEFECFDFIVVLIWIGGFELLVLGCLKVGLFYRGIISIKIWFFFS